MTDSTNRGVSPLDRAHGLRAEGKYEDAVRLAGSILAASAEDVGAAYLVARLLLDKNRSQCAGTAAEQLVDRFVRRGDMLSATLCAQLGAEAGGFTDDSLRAIAQAFGKGSGRVSDVSLRPPPLPADVQVAPFFAKLAGDALLEAAEKALTRFLAAKDSVPATQPLPRLPLFGALEPATLLKLLGALQVRELQPGEYILRQGDEGKEAFALVRGVLNVVREDDLEGPKVLAALGPGAVFGEMALVSDAPRTASVVAVETSHVLVAPRAQLETIALKDPALGRELGGFCHDRMVSNLMRHSLLMSAIEPKKRLAVVGFFIPETFQAGHVLVRQGEETDRLFLIASGGVEVRSTDADGDRVVLAQLGPGDVVGEISMVLRRPATADVVAVHSTVALALTQERFRDAIREHLPLLGVLYELATRREEETRSAVAGDAVDVSDVVLV